MQEGVPYYAFHELLPHVLLCAIWQTTKRAMCGSTRSGHHYSSHTPLTSPNEAAPCVEGTLILCKNLGHGLPGAGLVKRQTPMGIRFTCSGQKEGHPQKNEKTQAERDPASKRRPTPRPRQTRAPAQHPRVTVTSDYPSDSAAIRRQ
jgi:hypothetical protein